jgi:hypothetical protein
LINTQYSELYELFLKPDKVQYEGFQRNFLSSSFLLGLFILG